MSEDVGRRRWHVNLTPKDVSLLEDLVERRDSTSDAEAFRYILRLEATLNRLLSDGSKLYVKHPNGEETRIEFID